MHIPLYLPLLLIRLCSEVDGTLQLNMWDRACLRVWVHVCLCVCVCVLQVFVYVCACVPSCIHISVCVDLTVGAGIPESACIPMHNLNHLTSVHVTPQPCKVRWGQQAASVAW